MTTQSRTTLDGYGCATFPLRTAGITVFLGAYIDRAPNDGDGDGDAFFYLFDSPEGAVLFQDRKLTLS